MPSDSITTTTGPRLYRKTRSSPPTGHRPIQAHPQRLFSLPKAFLTEKRNTIKFVAIVTLVTSIALEFGYYENDFHIRTRLEDRKGFIRTYYPRVQP